MTQSQPILMSGAMVRAILEGRKSQTRRIIKPQPPAESVSVSETLMSRDNPAEEGAWEWWAGRPQQVIYGPVHLRYRRGQLLWVRETWSARMTHGWTIADARSGRYQEEILYRADGHESIDGWWPSIHMPREFSRLTLEVTGVKVERLQDISEEDAKAEGILPADAGGVSCWRGFEDCPVTPCASIAFQDLWTSINGPGSWEANPWIVAVSFTPHLKNIDQLEAQR